MEEYRSDSACDTLLQRLTRFDEDKPTLYFISSKGSIDTVLTRKQVQIKSDALATYLLHDVGLVAGETCLLVFPPGLDFVLAFLACIKAGVVAVPVYPPHPGKRKDVQMFAQVARDCGAKHALTCNAYNHQKTLSGIQQSFSLKTSSVASIWPKHLIWTVCDKVILQNNEVIEISYDEQRKNSDVAFLQYTSGSTSDPKGVMITHGNLAHNMTIFTNELKADERTVVVSWLPQYHDMGLIGSLLGILYCGGTGYYISPISFLQRPMIWLELVSKYKGTHLQSPNFAFKLTARKFDKEKYAKSDLDLSSVKHIINAAEPIDEESINLFKNTFCPYGLSPNCIFPTYGLAEHTVFVCSGGKQILSVDKSALEMEDKAVVLKNDNGDTRITRVVGCGYPSDQNVDVQIVNTESLKIEEEETVGEIWVNSPSKAAGYFNMPEKTKKDFFAIPEGSSNEYLRTGDLGFMINGELFICGRLKDLIIVAGRNHFPQDLEASCENAANALRPGCSGAFSITKETGGEEVFIVCELRELPSSKDKAYYCEGVADDIRKTIFQDHSVQVSSVILLEPRSVPKTTSGKISRSRCRKAYLSKTLNTVYTKSFANPSSTNSSLEIVNGHDSKTKNQRSPQDIRNLEKSIIKNEMKTSIGSLVSIPAESVSNGEALNTMLDSLAMSQLKGLIEREYSVESIPDEFLFQDTTTLNTLVEVVKLGRVPSDADFNANMNGPKSCSEAMGCPPGVCCIVM